MAEKYEPKPAKAFQPGPAGTGPKDAGAILFTRGTAHSEHHQVAACTAEAFSASAVPRQRSRCGWLRISARLHMHDTHLTMASCLPKKSDPYHSYGWASFPKGKIQKGWCRLRFVVSFLKLALPIIEEAQDDTVFLAPSPFTYGWVSVFTFGYDLPPVLAQRRPFSFGHMPSLLVVFWV